MSNYDFINRQIDYFTVTDSARSRIEELLRDKEYFGVKVALEQKGCSGMKYKIEFANLDQNVTKYDEVLILESGIKIFVDPKVSLFVIGMVMDFVTEDLRSGFVFTNPNEKGRCGCGESFYV